jgi:Uncharacterized conserved protein (DUF2358)
VRGQALTRSWYAENIKFEDPLAKFDSFTGYSVNIQILRALFDIKFYLHETTTIGVDQVSARYILPRCAARCADVAACPTLRPRISWNM